MKLLFTNKAFTNKHMKEVKQSQIYDIIKQKLKSSTYQKEANTMETTYSPTKSIVETMNASREAFKKSNGRLLTEEEAIRLTSDIRKELKTGETNENKGIRCN